MSNDDSVRITPISKSAPQAIVPSRPQVPEGQERAPTRDANPRMSVAIGQNCLETVRAGGRQLFRIRGKDGRPKTDWQPLAEEGETVEIKTVDANPPKRVPYVIGS